jgi:hypothetical protein
MCNLLEFLDPLLSTFEAGTDKISGEAHIKDLLGSKGCKNIR